MIHRHLSRRSRLTFHSVQDRTYDVVLYLSSSFSACLLKEAVEKRGSRFQRDRN